MQGPPDNYRPRTAGDRSGNTGPDSGVRDWQRNTWFGPAPLNTNPFDEPEDAPELRESRSENVTQHVGDFWNTPETVYQRTGPVRKSSGTDVRGRRAEKKKTHSRTIRIIAGTVLFLMAALLILRFAVFSVKEIRVTGNNAISAEQVIRASGIRRGDNILSLNEKAVEERLVSDSNVGYLLQFRYIATSLPSTVVISVREREACCWLTYCGIMYVMDKDCMVMYESENPAEQPQNLVEVKGASIQSNAMVKQRIKLEDIQQSIFTELFLEMKVLGCTDRIREADISNTASILLLTRDGYTASLGDRTDLHAKLRSLLLVQEELKNQGYYGGTINVINPEAPIYTP